MQFFRQGHLTMVVLLLGFGADPTLRDGQGEFMMVISIYFMSSNFLDHLIFLFHYWKNKNCRNYIGIVWYKKLFKLQIMTVATKKYYTFTPFLQIVFQDQGKKLDIWYYMYFFFYNGICVACQQHFFFHFCNK